MDNNRNLALNIIREVLLRGKKIRTAMATLDASSPGSLDRSFINEIVYGCIRHKILIEWVLDKFLKDPGRTPDETVLNLMMAIYQIKFMRVPEWAAVNEAVELEKALKGIPSLVNAVLRSYIKRGEEVLERSMPDDKRSKLSITYSHPKWMVERWLERFGNEAAELMDANNKKPPLTLRLNSLVSDEQTVFKVLDERGIGYSKCQYSPDGITLSGSSLNKVIDLIGKVLVQDEASQFISYLLDPRKGQKVLDACAAPGGKSTHISQLTSNKASVTSIEKSPERIEMLRSNIAMTGSSAVAVLSDVLGLERGRKYDRILLDAPCSALGVIRRNPDVKYRHKEKDLAVFHDRQTEMLLHLSDFLKKDGLMVYSVCSTEPEETVNVIRNFLNIKKDFYIIKGTDDLPIEGAHKDRSLDLFGDEGFFRTYPHRHNMDGFFGARMRMK